MGKQTSTPGNTWIVVALFILAFIIILPFALILGVLSLVRYWIWCALLYVWAIARRKRGVIIYSEHEAWGPWAERLAGDCHLIAMHWEDRAYWQSSLSLRSLAAMIAGTPRSLGHSTQRRMFPVVLLCGRGFVPIRIDFRPAWQKACVGTTSLVKEQEAQVRSQCKR